MRTQYLWHSLGPHVPACLQEMIDEADRDGDGEVNEEEFFRCFVGLALRLWSMATSARLLNARGLHCHALALSDVTCSLPDGHIAKMFSVIADTAGILAVGS